jgi:NAD+ synthase
VIKLQNYGLNIDPIHVKQLIVHDITKLMQKRETEGCLVIFSGQNDSFVSAKLAIEAVGLESVKLIILSDVAKSRRDEISSIAVEELDFSNESIVNLDFKKVAKQFEAIPELIPEGISAVPVIRQHKISQQLLRSSLVQKIVEERTLSHIGKSHDSKDEFFRELIAFSKVRKRLKTVLAYLIAERENLLVVSKTNKTEYKTGLYTSFGYGHASDIMPIGDLYRTQVLQLSEHLDISQEIRDLAHTDVMPGVSNKYQYFFEIGSNDVDKILIRLDAGAEAKSISKELDISEEKVERVNYFVGVSELQKTLPVIPCVNR